MSITKEQIEQITILSRLALTEEEKERYRIQLSQVLEYMDVLSEVDTDSVEETAQVTGLFDVVREDIEQAASPAVVRELIAQFPEKLGSLLKVKAVFKE